MIYINGQKSELELNQFANFEEVINAANKCCNDENEIITEVHLNNELFQELYPHQAEDIDINEIEKVEITSVKYVEMASQIVSELYKVTSSMRLAATQASEFLRRGDDADAFATINNMTDVIRNFLNMIFCFQSDFNAPVTNEYMALAEKYNQILMEVNEAMENEDWILVADLLEFEVAPLCSEWDEYLNSLGFFFNHEASSTVSQ